MSLLAMFIVAGRKLYLLLCILNGKPSVSCGCAARCIIWDMVRRQISRAMCRLAADEPQGCIFKLSIVLVYLGCYIHDARILP